MKLRLALVVALGAGALAAPAAGSSTAARWFVTPGKSGVSCELGLNRPSTHPATYVWCLAYRGGRPYRTAVAVQMTASAKLEPCHGLRCIGNDPTPDPVLKVGHSIDFGPFRCTSLRRGVRCTVRELGHGFRLSTHGLTRV